MMEADPTSPIAPARVRMLLVPVGQIKAMRFAELVKRLQVESVVRLGDISPINTPDRQTFSPLAFPNGCLIYNLITTSSTELRYDHHLYETFREPLITVGVVDGSQAEPRCPSVEETESAEGWVLSTKDITPSRALKTLHAAFPRAITTHIVIFDHQLDGGAPSLEASCTSIPPVARATSTAVKTFMCDISAHFLSDLAIFARDIDNLKEIKLPPTASGRAVSANELLQRSSVSSEPLEMDSRSSSPDLSLDSVKAQSLDLAATTEISRRPATNKDGSRAPSADGDSESVLVDHEHRSNDDRSLRLKPGTNTERGSSLDTRLSQLRSRPGIEERDRNRHKAKQVIVLGSLYLHAGRWTDALRELADGIARARAFNDYPWYAKGLENLVVTMLLLVWGRIEFTIPFICRPSFEKASANKEVPSGQSRGVSDALEMRQESHERLLADLSNLVPHLVKSIADAYQHVTRDTQDVLPQVVISESIIRLGILLASLHRTGSTLDDAILDMFVRGRPYKKRVSSEANASAVTKSDVSGFIFRAYPEIGVSNKSSIFDIVTILTGMISVLALAELHRKKAVLIREMLGILLPQLIQARKVGAAEAGIHPAASLAALHGLNLESLGGSSPTVDESVQQGFRGLLKNLCQSFCVAFASANDTVSCHPKQSEHNDRNDIETQSAMQSLANDLTKRHSGSFNLKTDILRLSANFAEALPSFSDVVQFSATLLVNAAIGGAPRLIGAEGMVLLDREDQLRCFTKLHRTLATVKAEDVSKLETTYWDAFLVRDVYLKAESLVEDLMRFPATHFSEQNLCPSTDTSRDGPFIHRSFKPADAPANGTSTLVAGNETTIAVMLQNLFDFEVIIEDMLFLTDGVSIEQKATSVVLGPSRLQETTISIVAQSAGVLNIFGCSIKIQGCRRRVFNVFRKSYSALAPAKLKSLNSADEDSAGVDHDAQQCVPKPENISLEVIAAQPRLSAVSHTLPQAIASVADGESCPFTVTVRNDSNDCHVNHVRLSLIPLTSIESASSDHDHPASSTTETPGGSVVHAAYPQLVQSVSSNTEILAGMNRSFQVSVHSTFGSGEKILCIDYATASREIGSEEKVIKYGRRLTLTFKVTLESSVIVQRFNILPLKNSPHTIRQLKAAANCMDADTSGNNERNGWCLFVLDIRNARHQPLQVKFEYHSNGQVEKNEASHRERFETSSEVLQPNETTRIVMPVQRICIYNDLVRSRSSQHHQVLRDLHAPDEDSGNSSYCLQRLKYILLSRLTGLWTECKTGRHGTVKLDSIGLSDSMVEAVCAADVGIELHVHHDSAKEPNEQRVPSQPLLIKAGQPCTLRVTMHNRTRRTIQPLLRLQSRVSGMNGTTSGVLNAIFWDGPQAKVASSISAHEYEHVDFAVVFAFPGCFEVTIIAESIGSHDGSSPRAPGIKNPSTQANSSVGLASYESKDGVEQASKATERQESHQLGSRDYTFIVEEPT